MDQTKTAFVTGGTGFLGRHIVDCLANDGWEVTVIHRAGSDIRHLQNRNLTLEEADITDAASLLGAMPERVDAVFHVAADTSQWSRLNARQDAINIGGTQNMVDAALQKGAGRFIHTSSISSFGCQPGIIEETTPSVAPRSIMNYERSKHRADEIVKAAIARGLDAVILNPTAIIGPGDTNNWARSFFLVRDGKLPGAPPGATSTCDVREVAKAHLSAYEKGKTGESYLLGGPAVSYVDMMSEISTLVGKTQAMRVLPGFALRFVGRLNGLVGALTGKEPGITPEIAYMMTQTMECTGEKARRELGYVHHNWRKSMRDSFEWLVAEGLYEEIS